jgi:hypothetical protein
MAHYIFSLVTTFAAFVGASVIVTLLLYLREKRIIKKLGRLKLKVSLSFKWLKIMIIIIVVIFGLLLMGLVFVILYVNSIELELRFIFQLVFLSVLLIDSFIFSKLLICEKGMAGLGIPLTYWDEISRIQWDRDVGQEMWGVKIFIYSLETPYRFFIPRNSKHEIEKLININK